MHESLKQIVLVYKLSGRLLVKSVDGVPPEKEFTRPDNTGNSMNWVAGHIVTHRFVLGGLVGLQEKDPWSGLYERGAQVASNDTYPSLSEIIAAHEALEPTLLKAFEEVSEERLLAKPPIEIPGMEENVRGIVTFLSFHENYHVGQLNYIRKMIGMDRLFG